MLQSRLKSADQAPGGHPGGGDYRALHSHGPRRGRRGPRPTGSATACCRVPLPNSFGHARPPPSAAPFRALLLGTWASSPPGPPGPDAHPVDSRRVVFGEDLGAEPALFTGHLRLVPGPECGHIRGIASAFRPCLLSVRLHDWFVITAPCPVPFPDQTAGSSGGGTTRYFWAQGPGKLSISGVAAPLTHTNLETEPK